MIKSISYAIILCVILIVSTLVGLFLSPKLPLLEGISFSKAIYDDHHQLLRLTLTEDEKYRFYVPLDAVPAEFKKVILLQEDRYFYWHPGINPIALSKAALHTYIKQSRRIGASTITMQLARIRFGLHSKTVLGKCQQLLYALRLEMHYSKKEILEAYLNLAPFGHNIEGVQAASLIYFGRELNQLAFPDFFTLSIIPQNPLHRLPDTAHFKALRLHLFKRWVKYHPEDKNKMALMQLPIMIQAIQDLPFFAPHFVNEIILNASLKPDTIVTTLDLALQNRMTHITRQYIEGHQNRGVQNAALLLVDTRDMGIKALLGSASFLNKTIQGQIDGTQIKRSPGSTLKPFIYALALDQGLIHPATVLKDVPHLFGSYNPDNFDYDFMGPIKARDALVLSRNIPAIDLNAKLKNPNLYGFLQAANISELKSEHYYGLTLALGGAPVTMQELATLYATLLNQGLWYPLRKRNDEPFSRGKRLLSPEASFLVLDMLKNKEPFIFKTGTSSGYHDAWTAGVLGPYVLIVWLGNFDNQSNPAFIGKSLAEPLLIQLLDALRQEEPITAFSTPPRELNLIQIPVCKASGLLPTPFCKETEITWFIPGKSPITTDTVFREVAIDTKTGLRACEFNHNTHFEIDEFWSSDLLHVFKQAGIARKTPPPFNPECASHPLPSGGLAPHITSPDRELNYVIPHFSTTARTIPFTAVADGDVNVLYWFINETFLGKTNRDQPFLWRALPGTFVVRVVDDHGRADASHLQVRLK